VSPSEPSLSPPPASSKSVWTSAILIISCGADDVKVISLPGPRPLTSPSRGPEAKGVDRDDIMTLTTAVLGGLGAVALLLGALAEAIGLRGGDVTLYVGLAMLLASAVMLALLLVPARRR